MKLFLEIKFKGGLGNQLFQYATARCLSHKRSIPYLLFNTDNYGDDGAGRQFGLMNYKVKGALIEKDFVKRLLRKGTKLNKSISSLPVCQEIVETGLKLHTFPETFRPLTSLSGYWQSEVYFKEIRGLLLEELVPRNLPGDPHRPTDSATVAIHVRRTDYLVENGFGSLSENYYDQAIRLIREKIKDPVFMIFSDDIEWCRERFQDKDMTFVDDPQSGKDYLQLYLMSQCHHQIIANSSFSWWAAWLNANPAKIVIRPQRPFLDPSLQYESYYPAEWIAVDN